MKKIINSLKGNLLGFGIQDEEILKSIDKNKNIVACDLINSISIDEDGKGKNKKVNIKKLKKIYGYKKVDNIIIDSTKMKNDEKRLISTYIYLSKDSIYLYNVTDLDKLKRRYFRYNVKISIIENDETKVLVNAKDAKPHKVFDKLYYIIDFFTDLFDTITDLLIS